MSIKGIIITIVGLVWLWAIYTGYTTMIKKTVDSTPSTNTSATAHRYQEQRKKAVALREQQKRLIEDRKTRLRDMQNLQRR